MNYVLIGKKFAHDYPEDSAKYVKRLAELRSESLPISSLPDSFERFCSTTDIRFKAFSSRVPVKVADDRRLFIAVAILLHDPLWLNGYTGRMRDRLNIEITAHLHCNSKWISQIADNLRFEYFNLKHFRFQVNMLAYSIRYNKSEAAA